LFVFHLDPHHDSDIMDKTLALALNKYVPIPVTLRVNPSMDEAAKSVSVGLASLYHHYYLDSYGGAPPNPDPAQFEHIRYLLPCSDFRFQGAGLGVSPTVKGHRSNELGHAFCRWFLHDHLNITYFAHMAQVMGRQRHRPFGGWRIERATTGDTPDYFCAESITQVFLAEAKGRYSSISFKNREFTKWRAQFERVTVYDSSGAPCRVKGHLVATRFSTEEDSLKLKSGIWAEDPESPGERPLNADASGEISLAVIAAHYSSIAIKLGQRLLASALASGVGLPEQIRILGIAWGVTAGPLQGRRFVGGYFADDAAAPILRDINGQIRFERPDPLRLDRPGATFFGVEETIFRQLVDFARAPRSGISDLVRFEQTDFFYSGFSVLRDGSALGPLEFFSPIESVNY
jgi:hypothetical protein